MPSPRVVMKCLAQAVYRKGLRGLVEEVPFGPFLFDIATEFVTLLRQKRQEAEVRELIEVTAQESTEDAKHHAEAVAVEVAADQGPEVQEALAGYVAQLPAMIRQSLRRPSDLEGVTVPATQVYREVEDVLPLLPVRLPRFRAGDSPPNLPDWTLTELLGTGGFGEVWKGQNPYLGDSAFKFCLDTKTAVALINDATLIHRVQREGRHTGVVELLDTQLGAEPPFLRFEYMSGGDLVGVFKDWQPIPTDRRIRMVTDLVTSLAKTVGHFHRLSPPIVHRDLKPANILVKRTEKKLTFRIADFGIGGVAADRALEAGRTGSTTRGDLLATSLRGSHTPLYASPEQRSGALPDPRDDVHALGVIWYQLLLLDPTVGPGVGFESELRELGVSDHHISLLTQCVVHKAERRFADAHEMAEALRIVPDVVIDAEEFRKPSPPPPPRPEPPSRGNRVNREVPVRRSRERQRQPEPVRRSGWSLGAKVAAVLFMAGLFLGFLGLVAWVFSGGGFGEEAPSYKTKNGYEYDSEDSYYAK